MDDTAPSASPAAETPSPRKAGYKSWKAAFTARTADNTYSGVFTVRDCHASYPPVEAAWARIESCARVAIEQATGHDFLTFSLYAITPLAETTD